MQKLNNNTDETQYQADKQSYSIKGLMPSTRYEAKIAAGTDSGLGEYTKDWVDASTNVTKCKGTQKILNVIYNH